MSTQIQRGRICYVSRGFRDQALADRFARCLRANGRFCRVDVYQRAGRHVVAFEPANEQRQGAIREQQEQARADRAAQQPFEFYRDPDRPHTWWCHSLASEMTYELTLTSCDCGDFINRASRVGLRCKHLHALHALLIRQAEERTAAQEAARAPWTREEYQRHMAEDFC